MPVNDVPTMNSILAGWLGPNRGDDAADSYTVRLWCDDPRGVSPAEADWGGYTPPTWDSDDWLDPDGGVVTSDGSPDFGAPSSAGSDSARYWGLHDGSTCVYSAPLASAITVSASSAVHVRIRLTVPFGGRD